MNNNEKFLVYENWTADQKAVVHKATCGHANEAHLRIEAQWLRDNHAPNDRWFGYFGNLNEAISFAALLPNRQLKMCGHCLQNEKGLI